MKSISDKLRVLREFKNYTQEFLGSVLNKSQSAYSRLESGDSDRIILGDLIKLLGIYELTTEEFFAWNGEMNFSRNMKFKQKENLHFVENQTLNDEKEDFNMTRLLVLEAKIELLSKAIHSV